MCQSAADACYNNDIFRDFKIIVISITLKKVILVFLEVRWIYTCSDQFPNSLHYF